MATSETRYQKYQEMTDEEAQEVIEEILRDIPAHLSKEWAEQRAEEQITERFGCRPSINCYTHSEPDWQIRVWEFMILGPDNDIICDLILD